MSTNVFATRAWQLLGGDPENAAVRPVVSGAVDLPSRLDVAGLVTGSVTVAAAALHRVMVSRGQVATPPEIHLDGARLTTSAQSERHFRRDGAPADVWAPLSGYWPAADGWVRTHGNYPHHADRLRRLLGLPPHATAEDLAAAIATRDARTLEAEGAEAGAVIVAVRSLDEWRREPHAAAVAAQPLLRVDRIGDAPVRGWPTGPWPLSGIRVLDLTRVIAGPVATRDLAFAGADVIRIDPPHLPEIEWQHLDTGPGKRSIRLDLRAPADRRTFDDLLATADVVVTGYRPGALDRLGLGAEALAERAPGVVVGSVSAWGTTGTWALRRGFDSIVQAASGIAMIESADGHRPGALPAQALDHSAGHYLAAAITTALDRQRREGGTWAVAVALARLAHELMTADRPGDHQRPRDVAPALQTGRTAAGELVVALPVLTYRGSPGGYPELSHPSGTDEPRWQSRR